MKYAPLVFVIGYICLTMLLMIAGPVIYFGFNPVITSIFLLFLLLVMAVGYIHGVRVLDREVAQAPDMSKLAHSILPLFYFSLAIALGSLILLVISGFLSGTVNFSVDDLGTAYHDAYGGYQRNTGNYSLGFIITSLAAPFTFIASIWGIYYFRSIPKIAKAAVLTLVIGSLFFYTIGSGKQKQLGDFLIHLIAIGAIVYARSGKGINLRIIVPAIGLGIVALFGFVAILGQRYAALSIDVFSINSRIHRLQFIDVDHPIFKLFGNDAGFSLALFSSYLSQGYFGLSLALESDFTWSYMIGFSYTLSVIINRGLGLPWAYEHTYPYQVGLQTGWGESKWHSAFSSWASDFTFPGTILLFGFFAYVFAKCWNESFRMGNPYAILLFAMMTLGAFFLPANNQLFITPGSVATVLLVSGLYIAFRKRFNEASKAAAL